MPGSPSDERVVIMAPVGQDADAMASLLCRQGLTACVGRNASECLKVLREGAGALLVTEEALDSFPLQDLVHFLEAQPPWSELPVIILTSGSESRRMRLLDLTSAAEGSVTLLERPMTAATLLVTVRVALRSRRRQYQVRDLLEAQRRSQKALADAQEQLKEHAVNLEQAVAARTADLRETNERLETFVYSVAHDLRAPLRSMSGYSQLLLEDHLLGMDETAQHLVKRIQASAEFMDELLLDLLAYGRTECGEIRLEPVPILRAWQLALYQCAAQMECTGAEVETIPPLPEVLAHEGMLGQVFTNLLENALKFVAPDVRPRIRVWAEPLQGRARIWIQDNGIGIPSEQHERVFRVFERSAGSQYPGTGIGLAIVRKGIERMNGAVGIQSEPGKGSRFWIELPTPR